MAKIIEKTNLNDTTIKFVVKAPDIAQRAKPGQFIILRLDEKGKGFLLQFLKLMMRMLR